MATAKNDLIKHYQSTHPGQSLKNAARDTIQKKRKPHVLPETITLTIVNLAASVKTACFLNSSGLDYSKYANLQASTTANGLQYSTTYGPGVDRLRALLKEDHYVVAGYTLNCDSDANAEAGQFSVATFENIFLEGANQRTETLVDQLVASTDKSSFNKITRAVIDQFVCSNTNDTVIDLIANGKLVISLTHAGKTSGVAPRY